MNDHSSSARWSRLQEIASDLADAESLDEVIQVIRISARTVAGADGITFVRREGDFVHYVAEDAIGPLWSGQSFPIASCISGIAMLAREPVIIPDVFADPRVPHRAYEPTFVKSMAMFPVGVDQMPAAIGAYWSRPGNIDEDTIDILAALAKTTGATLNALGVIVTPPGLPPAPR